MGDWYVRCENCLKDDCCRLWHDLFKGKLVFTAGEGPGGAKKCKKPCQCFVIVQSTDKAENPTKVLDEDLFSGVPDKDGLTIKQYDEDFKGGKYKLVAACLKMKEGKPQTVPIPKGGKEITSAAKLDHASKFAIVKQQDVVRERGSDRVLVVLKKP